MADQKNNQPPIDMGGTGNDANSPINYINVHTPSPTADNNALGQQPMTQTSPDGSTGTASTLGSQALLLTASFSTVSTACLGCRGKHLKCNGQYPCSRCLQAEIECVYIASRRGYKGPRKPNKRLRSSSNSPPPLTTPVPVSAPASVAGIVPVTMASIMPGAMPGTLPTTLPSSVAAPPDSCPMLLGGPRRATSTGAAMQVPMSGVAASYPPTSMMPNSTVTSSLGSMPPGYITAGALSGLPATTAALDNTNLGMVTSPMTSMPPIDSMASMNPMNPMASMALMNPMAAATMPNINLYRNPFVNGLEVANLGAAGNTTMAFSAPPISLEDRCFESFYYYFFGGHPFVLPKAMLLSLAKDESTNIAHLVAAMRYIGSLYLEVGPARPRLFDEAMRLAYLPTCPKDGFLVQTLVLLTIGLDGSCEQERARQLLADCERIAVEIGLNHRSFAAANGRGSPVMEESWRRTWWDLFVVDGMVAGVHRMTNFLLFDIPADVALPCEEQQYLTGNIPAPSYVQDLDDQVFTGDDRAFSSFAYRIAAARILGRFMRCPPIVHAQDENLEKIESLLTNWRMHLPPAKRDDLTQGCQLDEMMFQAHFMVHACSILLHQPHSQLDSSPTRAVTSCAPHNQVPSGDVYNSHTRHTITAACEISKMVTQAVPLLSHTHFFTCVITLSSVVHLSKWALYFLQDEEDLRQQIRLNIGALNKLSDVWRAANTAGEQVKSVAQEIYRAKKAQQINPAFWVGFTQEEMLNSINADESIMSEFDNIPSVTTH